jgi:kelch-like protein 6
MQNGVYSNVVEMYDAELNTWTLIEPMNHQRCQPGVAVSRSGLIYVVGGLGETIEGIPGAIKSAEVYDPSHNEWTQLADMYFCRHSPAVAAVDEKLFVFGGGSPSTPLRPGPERTVECLDLVLHEWQVLPRKMPGRANVSYVADFFGDLDMS